MCIDFREMTALAIRGLNAEQARRVGKALDIAIGYGAIEHATGNESLQDIDAVKRVTVERLERLRSL